SPQEDHSKTFGYYQGGSYTFYEFDPMQKCSTSILRVGIIECGNQDSGWTQIHDPEGPSRFVADSIWFELASQQTIPEFRIWMSLTHPDIPEICGAAASYVNVEEVAMEFNCLVDWK